MDAQIYFKNFKNPVDNIRVFCYINNVETTLRGFAMAFWSHTKDTVGRFVEKEVGNYFEYSMNDELVLAPPSHGGKNMVFPHKVWVGGLVNDQGWRAAKVCKTVVHIITDEDEYGRMVVQKWDIKNHVVYGKWE